MATSMMRIERALMNHNENGIDEEMLDDDYHRFVIEVHEILSDEIDQDDHVEQDEHVVVSFLFPNHSSSNDANDIHHHN